MAANLGVKVARIATHVTEADISEQHMDLAKKRGMEVMGFLMMAHMAPIEVMVHNGRLMHGYAPTTFMSSTRRATCCRLKFESGLGHSKRHSNVKWAFTPTTTSV